MAYFDQIWKIIFEAEKARGLYDQLREIDQQGGERDEQGRECDGHDERQGGEDEQQGGEDDEQNQEHKDDKLDKMSLKLVKVTNVKDKLHLHICAFYFKDPFEIDCYQSNLEELAKRFMICELIWQTNFLPDTFIESSKLIIECLEFPWPLDILCAYLRAQEVHVYLPWAIKKNYKMNKTAELVQVFLATGAKKVTVRLPICFLDYRTHSYERFITFNKIEHFIGPYKLRLRQNFLDILA